MAALTVLVTGSGAPGIGGTLYSLKNNFDRRQIRIIGTDVNPNAIGRCLCDRFYQIARPTEEDYLTDLQKICTVEHVDVVIPQNTAELPVLAEHAGEFAGIGTRVAVSNSRAIEAANSKQHLMVQAAAISIPCPEWYSVGTADALQKYAERLGWPEKRVVVKPPVSNGMRGFRIIDEGVDLREQFYVEKPMAVRTQMGALISILGDSFPELLVMEYLPGPEYTVDLLNGPDTFVAVPRRRDRILSGITFSGVTEQRRDLIDHSAALARHIGLKYAFGFQFKDDQSGVPKLLESNPRVQGTMVLSTFSGANIIYGAVKLALGEEIPDFDVQWDTWIMRYWGGLSIRQGRQTGIL